MKIPDDNQVLQALILGAKPMAAILDHFHLENSARHAVLRVLKRLKKAGRVTLNQDNTWELGENADNLVKVTDGTDLVNDDTSDDGWGYARG